MANDSNSLTKLANALDEKDKKIQAAMAKAIAEVRRDAKVRGIKLAVASKSAWAIPK